MGCCGHKDKDENHHHGDPESQDQSSSDQDGGGGGRDDTKQSRAARLKNAYIAAALEDNEDNNNAWAEITVGGLSEEQDHQTYTLPKDLPEAPSHHRYGQVVTIDPYEAMKHRKPEEKKFIRTNRRPTC